MAGEFGHFALILALMLALCGAIVPHIGIYKADRRLMALSSQMAYGQSLMVAFAFGALIYGFITSDFSIINVATNSHTAKPLLYKIAGTWGNHEGSL
ncbi:MAG: heme lyase NrfEFG subunit NrfE, partial [Kordiimonadaceae bacterium]|nr:heme lyase NrfEFG subunit NrfE [Kordiimonadaceae bacterium]